jgi:hypothetical protein
VPAEKWNDELKQDSNEISVNKKMKGGKQFRKFLFGIITLVRKRFKNPGFRASSLGPLQVILARIGQSSIWSSMSSQTGLTCGRAGATVSRHFQRFEIGHGLSAQA